LKTQPETKQGQRGLKLESTEDHTPRVLYECEKKSFAEEGFKGAT
jgi:hypothetical protein